MEEYDDNMDKGYTEKYIRKDLINAYKIDARSAPRRLGSLNRVKDFRYERNWENVTTDHDV